MTRPLFTVYGDVSSDCQATLGDVVHSLFG